MLGCVHKNLKTLLCAAKNEKLKALQPIMQKCSMEQTSYRTFCCLKSLGTGFKFVLRVAGTLEVKAMCHTHQKGFTTDLSDLRLDTGDSNQS